MAVKVRWGTRASGCKSAKTTAGWNVPIAIANTSTKITKTANTMRRRAFIALAAVIPLYLLAALAGALIPGSHTKTAPGGSITIYLLRGPIHYDFLLPLTPEVRQSFAFTDLDLHHPGADWLVVGWGGKDFYTTIGTYRDVSARAVWKGITGDASVLRLSLAGRINDVWPTKPLSLSQIQFTNLLSAITAEVAEHTPLSTENSSEFARFYPATTHFHIFQTCNVWIGQTLRTAGLSFGLWTPTPYAVTLAAKVHLR